MEFTPTHTIGGTPVCEKHFTDGGMRFVTAEGEQIRPSHRRPLVDINAPVIREPSEVFAAPDMPQTVRLHADAVCCLIRAAVMPEWACSHGTAQSARGDSAEVLNERGPNGEKVVRICTVSPGRVSAFYDILVPQFMSFEIR